jgi:hypothetical protein
MAQGYDVTRQDGGNDKRTERSDVTKSMACDPRGTETCMAQEPTQEPTHRNRNHGHERARNRNARNEETDRGQRRKATGPRKQEEYRSKEMLGDEEKGPGGLGEESEKQAQGGGWKK